MRPDPNAPPASGTHTFNSILESGDYAPFANPERIPLVLLDGISTIQEQAVFNLYSAPAIGNSTVTDYEVLILYATAAPVHASA